MPVDPEVYCTKAVEDESIRGSDPAGGIIRHVDVDGTPLQGSAVGQLVDDGLELRSCTPAVVSTKPALASVTIEATREISRL